MRHRLAVGFVLSALAGIATPAAAQDTISASLCLFVEVPAGVTSVDAESATAMIAAGEMVIAEVVPSDGSVQPPARSPRTESSEVPGTTVGRWFVSGVLSGREDGTTAIAGMNAVEGLSSDGAPVTFAIRCHDDEIDALVTWEDVVHDEHPSMTFTYGSGRTRSVEAQRSSDQTATFYPASEVDDLLATLATESVLEVTLHRDGAPPLRAEFDVSRADEALMTVSDVCAAAP